MIKESVDTSCSNIPILKVVFTRNILRDGILKVISVLNRHSLLASRDLFTEADRNLIGQNIDLFFGDYFDNYLPIARRGKEVTTATGTRTSLSMYSKEEVDVLLAGKAHAGDTHGIRFYSGTAGDPAHEHLVQGTTGIEQ